MSELTKIWSGLEAETYTSILHFVLIEGEYDEIYMDNTTFKLIKRKGDEIDILLEFNGINYQKYQLVGTLNDIYENPDMILDHIDSFVKYEESWTEPIDKNGWEKFEFIDETGRAFQFMHKNHKWIKKSGNSYPNYNMPKDVSELYPLLDPIDSLKTLMRKFNVDFQQKNYVILKRQIETISL
jgi:hypothetical protein